MADDDTPPGAPPPDAPPPGTPPPEDADPPGPPAEENPWYVLATLWGEQPEDDFDPDLHAKNRRAWNRWVAQALTGEAIEGLVAKGADPEDFAPLSAEERGALERRASARGHDLPDPGTPDKLATIDFRGCIFEGTFWGINFVWPAVAEFDGAIFCDTADFDGATFRDRADFHGAIFCDTADFGGATFRDRADFHGATFRDMARFARTTFRDKAGFHGATFRGWAGFDGATFRDWASFAPATFRGTADFDGATFRDMARFDGATFRDRAGFHGATFRDRAGFHGATFRDWADFDGATFRADANFRRARFCVDLAPDDAPQPALPDEFRELARLLGTTVPYYHADFSRCTFQRRADFSEGRFFGPGDFARTEFASAARFDDAQFERGCRFALATFQARAIFAGTRFVGHADFSGRRFAMLTDFSRADFADVVPNFRDRAFPHAVEWGDRWPDPPADPARAKKAEAKYSALRHAMDEAGRYDEARNFFARELACRAVHAGPFWRAVIASYRALSDFGRSVVRPLVAWTAALLVAWIVQYAAMAPPGPPKAHAYAFDTFAMALGGAVVVGAPVFDPWRSTLLEFDLGRALYSDFGCGTNAPASVCLEVATSIPGGGFAPAPRAFPDAVKALQVLHAAFSALCLFLAGLGLRNWLRLR